MPVLLLAVPVVYNTVEQLAAGRSYREQQSSNMRILMWERGEPLVMARPVLGYGGGTSAELAGVRANMGGTYTIDDYYLSTLLDSGYVGAVLLGLFLLSLVIGTLSKRSH